MAARPAGLRVAALAALAIAGAACGFDRPAPYPGVRLPDVAPWEDLGPVIFCQGELRLGNPGSAPAGFCGAPAPLAACTRDADCRSRERCTCAGCQVALCDSGDECGDGQACSFTEHRCDRTCEADGDCAAGERCDPGSSVCFGPCAADGDCQGGERCDGGRCRTAVGTLGDPCAVDGDCAAGLSCALQRTPADLRRAAPLGDTLYLEIAGAAGSAIHRAVREGGPARFRLNPAPVVAPGPTELGRAGGPSAAREGGATLLYFADGAGRIRRATSPDGVTFTVEPDPVLSPAAAWEASGLDAPSIATLPDGRRALYYGLSDGSALGVALSSDGRSFTARTDPALRPADVTDPTLWRGVDAIVEPDAFVASPGGPVHLYFSARGRESGAALRFGVAVSETPNFSVGEAATTDGTTLVPWPFDPAFDRVRNFLDHLDERAPAVTSDGDVWYLYYRGSGPGGAHPTNIGLATNPVLPR